MKTLIKGQEVIDRWYPDWGNGTCTKALKTAFHIQFSIKGKMVYDKPHLQFLEPVEKK